MPLTTYPLAGPQGDPGPTGPQGDPGEGVPTGGTTGQLLQKASATDFDTVWATTGATYSNEDAQDAVGSILVDTATVDLTYDDATPQITASVIDGSITFAKLADISTDVLLGRDTAATGDVEEISVGGNIEFTGSGSLRRGALTGDVTASAGSGATTIPNNTVTYAKMQDVSAASHLLGRGDSGTGDPQEITLGTGLTMSGTTLSATAGTTGHTIKEAGSGLTARGALNFLAGFDLVDDSVGDETEISLDLSEVAGSGDLSWTGNTPTIPSDTVTYAKMQNVSAASKLLGRGDSGSGDPQELSLGTSLAITGTTLDIATGGIDTAEIADDAVNIDKLSHIATDRLLGRDTAASGPLEPITVGGGVEFTGSGGIQRSALTGDVTASAGSSATTIAAAAVTYAKIQDVSAASKLLGRGSAAGSGDVEEITLGTNLSMSGTTLNASGGGGGHTIKEEGASMTARGSLNFLAGFDLTDDSGNDETEVALDLSEVATGGDLTWVGNVPTVADDAITFAKMADTSIGVIGKSTTGAGDPELIAASADDRLLARASSALSFTQATTGMLGANVVTDGKLRDSGALSVIGRSANSSGDPADISATAASDAVLRESGSTLGFGTIATGGIAADAVTFAKMQNITSDRLIGRDTASSGDPEEITVGGGLEFSGSTGIQRSALTGDVTASAGNNATTIATAAVTLAKMADIATDRLIGRDTTGTGVPEALTVGGGLEFSGSGGIQRSALTGAVTASAGSNATSQTLAKTATILNPSGAINVIGWRAPHACTVTNVRGYRVGGSGATVNARLNGSSNHLSSAVSLTSADTWTDGGSVQNTAYAAGDKLEFMVVSVTGSPTQVAIQVDFTRP